MAQRVLGAPWGQHRRTQLTDHGQPKLPRSDARAIRVQDFLRWAARTTQPALATVPTAAQSED